MFKQFISKVEGADRYMVSSFIIFLVFFVLVGLYLYLVDKNQLKSIAELPFDDGTFSHPNKPEL